MVFPKMHGLFRISLPKMHGRFRIDLPKMHGRFHIGLPKVHGWFRMVPPQVSKSICSHQISTVGEFQGTMTLMQEKQQNHLFEMECHIGFMFFKGGLS